VLISGKIYFDEHNYHLDCCWTASFRNEIVKGSTNARVSLECVDHVNRFSQSIFGLWGSKSKTWWLGWIHVKLLWIMGLIEPDTCERHFHLFYQANVRDPFDFFLPKTRTYSRTIALFAGTHLLLRTKWTWPWIKLDTEVYSALVLFSFVFVVKCLIKRHMDLL